MNNAMFEPESSQELSPLPLDLLELEYYGGDEEDSLGVSLLDASPEGPPVDETSSSSHGFPVISSVYSVHSSTTKEGAEADEGLGKGSSATDAAITVDSPPSPQIPPGEREIDPGPGTGTSVKVKEDNGGPRPPPEEIIILDNDSDDEDSCDLEVKSINENATKDKKNLKIADPDDDDEGDEDETISTSGGHDIDDSDLDSRTSSILSTSSSSGSSSESESSSSDDEDESSTDKIENAFAPKTNFLEFDKDDNENEERIIPLDDENETDGIAGKVQVNDEGQMFCTVCCTVFKSKLRFLIHRRRHFAVDHFKCPICKKGFTQLSQCQAHELRVHHGYIPPGSGSGISDTQSQTNNSKSNEGVPPSETTIVPSTGLFPYCGPPIKHPYEPYFIEVKHGRTEKKSHSRITATYTLDCLKRRTYERPELIENLGELAKFPSYRSGDKPTEVDLEDEESDDDGDSERNPNPVSTEPVFQGGPSSSETIARRRRAMMSSIQEVPKLYYCSICWFHGDNPSVVRGHATSRHPELQTSEIVKSFERNFNLLNNNKKGKKKPKGSPSKQTAVKRKVQRESRKTKAARKLTGRNVDLDLDDEEALAAVRRGLPRVWEKNKKPKKGEFIAALSLVPKGDVVLGFRRGTESLCSSLFRKRRTAKSPDAPRPVVVLEKLDIFRNRVYLCNQCNFKSVSKAEINPHRRFEHGGRPR